ncbi:MAG TPA: low molecular weight phosphatase family protein [Candidatus Bathyarchaeia archaeon]|nr:low molecular weight phosphatase family protein [Candidatus Bathyarchaeia archaeon]
MKILFVCSGNSYRSPVAEALMRKYAPRGVDVDSAGTSPITWISEHARQFLQRENASKYLKTHPEGIETRRLRDYDLIVAMEMRHRFSILQQCPECADKIEVWNIDDPYDTSAEYEEEVYRQIESKVKELAVRLSKKSLPRIG